MTDKTKCDFSDSGQYLQQTEGDRRERAANWQTAIGLQAVDGLKTSAMLYPGKPKHPRQKHLLAAKGTTLFNEPK